MNLERRMAKCDVGWVGIIKETLHQNQFLIKGPWAFINYCHQMIFQTKNSDKEILSHLSDGYTLIKMLKITTSSFKCFLIKLFVGL